MRRSTMLLAAAALATPAAALADGCPRNVTGEFETSLGEIAAWLEPGQTVYTPAGLTMFDKPVSYVVVKRSSEGGPVEELNYRFKDVVRAVGSEYPDDLRRSFDREFQTSGCASRSNPVCTVAFDGKSDGTVAGGKLSMGDLWVPDEARGPALPLVESDLDMTNGDPVFLICLY